MSQEISVRIRPSFRTNKVNYINAEVFWDIIRRWAKLNNYEYNSSYGVVGVNAA
jgi:hypothetical protein